MKLFLTIATLLSIMYAHAQGYMAVKPNNCLETAGERVCCDTSKQASPTLITSVEEFEKHIEFKKNKEYKSYGDLKDFLAQVDFSTENIALIDPEELPITTELLAVSASCDAFRELYGEILIYLELKNKRLMLDYFWSGGCNHSFYWKKILKSETSTQSSCSCGIMEVKRGK